MAQYMIVRSGRFWKGVCVIKVRAVPRILAESEAFTRELLSICLSERFAAELDILAPDKTDGRFQLFLLIRRTSGIRKELEDRMELVPDIVLRRLCSAGFDARLLDSDELPDLETVSVFTGNGATDLHGTGFYPSETDFTLGAEIPFVPGSYSSMIRTEDSVAERLLVQDPDKKSYFRWDKLLGRLVHYPGSLFVVQLIPTALTGLESNLVRTGLSRAVEMTEEAARKASKHFAELIRIIETRGFLVTMFVLGNKSVNQDISYLMREWGLESYSFLEGSLQNADYLFNGADQLSGAANVLAHAEKYRGNRFNIRWSRLSRINSLETVSYVFGLMGDAEKCPGLPLGPNPNDLDLLPPEMTSAESSIDLGYRVADRKEVYLPLNSLIRHGCVVGKTGSGKTVFFLSLLHKLQQADTPVPFIVIEPVKTEYRSLKDVIPGLNILTAGNDMLTPLELNPFMPPEGITIGEHKQSLNRIFDISFSMTSLLQSMFPQAVDSCYAKYGWRDSSTSASDGVQSFGLQEFICEFRQYVIDHVKEKSSRNDVENSGVLRLQKLLSANPVMFDTNCIPDYEKMLTEPTLIELDAVTEDEQKILVLTTLLINLMAVIRKRKDAGGKLRNLILIDEAHVVLNAADQRRDAQGAAPAATGLKLLQDMAQIMRGLGTALFFGDQSAAKLTREIFSAAETKILFRMNDPEDRKTIAQSMLMTDEMMNDIVSVDPGEGFLYTGTMRKPVLIQTPNAEKELGLRKAITDEELLQSVRPEARTPYIQCTGCAECAAGCDRTIRSDARAIAKGITQNSRTLKKILSVSSEKPQAQSALPEYLSRDFVDEAKKSAAAAGVPWTERLAACARIHMIRFLLLDGQCHLTEKQLEGKEQIEGISIPDQRFLARGGI